MRCVSFRSFNGYHNDSDDDDDDVYFSKQSLFARARFTMHTMQYVMCVCVSSLFLCHIIKHKVKPIEKSIRTSYFYRIRLLLCNIYSKRERERSHFHSVVGVIFCVLSFFWHIWTFPDLDVFMCVMKSASLESKMVEWYQSDVKRQNAIKKRKRKRERMRTNERRQNEKPIT